MLNVNVNAKTKDFRVMAAGGLTDVVNDLAHVIQILYVQMKQSAHPEAAEDFRRAMIALHTDSDSPLFLDMPVGGDGITIVTNGREG